MDKNSGEEIQSDPEILIFDINSDKEIDNLNLDYRNSNYKMIKIYFEEISEYICLKQDHKLGKGGILWDCSYVLTKVLIDLLNKEYADNKDIRMLELGAGTALPSIIARKLGYNKIVITDLKAFVPFIEEILKINNITVNDNTIVSSMNWQSSDDITKLKITNETFDIIIGSDILYLDEYFDDLIHLFRELSNKNTIIIISFKVRLIEVNNEFFEKFSIHFEYTYIADDFIKKYYPLVNKLKVIIAKLKI